MTTLKLRHGLGTGKLIPTSPLDLLHLVLNRDAWTSGSVSTFQPAPVSPGPPFLGVSFFEIQFCSTPILRRFVLRAFPRSLIIHIDLLSINASSL